MVEKQAFMFITGPDVIKAVTGELTDTQSLGGSSGAYGYHGYFAPDSTTEDEALALTRRVLSYFPSNNVENPPYITPDDDPLRMDEELNSIVLLIPRYPTVCMR